MSNIGELELSEIQKKYNVDFNYAKNIAEKLVEIGYTKPKSERIYSIISTEEQIDSYIKNYIKSNPLEYAAFDLKGNYILTIKRKISDVLNKIRNAAPRFFRRLIFSIPSFILLILFTLFLAGFVLTNEGRHLYTWEILVIDILFYCVCIFPANIVFRIWHAKYLKMNFIDYMCLPKNWFLKNLSDTYNMQKLLHPEKKFITALDYNSTLKASKQILEQKVQLIKHYSEIMNTSYDENEFHTAVNSIIDTLRWMMQFEKYGVFEAGYTPSEDLHRFQIEMPSYEESLKNRISERAKQKLTLTQLNLIDTMDGHLFEYYCADLLKKNGFTNVEVTRGSGDHGIDVLAEKEGNSYAIQCKCYSSNIGNSAVQQAYTGKDLYKRDIAVVITNQYFTPQAIAEGTRLRVKLWDRNKLFELINNSPS